MLYEAERHEPLLSIAWDEAAVRGWIARLVEDTHRAFSPEDLWPMHPHDRVDEEPVRPFTMLYFGAAGVIWALDHLARAGAGGRSRDYAPLLDGIADRNLALVTPWGYGVEGLLMGQAGIRLLQYRLAPGRAAADAVAAAITANADHSSLELLWGSPGTMHVGLTMHEWTGEARWADLFRADAGRLLAALLPAGDAPCRIWTQDLYGSHERFIGAGHGFAGNASALIRGRALLPDASWEDAVVETAGVTALREGPLANWAPSLTAEPVKKLLVQWCHGAPGMVTSLAHLPDRRLDELLVAAGELTWAAGPLAKGAGLCHGTAGNGYAFLKLFKRTGDARWLERARAFAMHAIAQSDRTAAELDQRRHSLWTGDSGVACYLWSCVTGDDALPNLDRSA